MMISTVSAIQVASSSRQGREQLHAENSHAAFNVVQRRYNSRQ